MKLGMFALFDRKAGMFGQPFFANNGGSACRLIYMREKQEGTFVTEFPEDFFVARLAEYDQVSGEVVPVKERFEIVGECKEIMARLGGAL